MSSVSLDQTLEIKDYEIIVINDGSKDKTNFVTDLFKDEIKVIKNRSNRGLPYSINHILAAKGRYVVRVEQMIMSIKNFLIFHIILSNPEIDAVSCDYFLVDERK